MTKAEAIKEMQQGHQVTHSLFSPHEWVKMYNGNYQFEDGNICSPEDFWKYRQQPIWLNDWRIYNQK